MQKNLFLDYILGNRKFGDQKYWHWQMMSEFSQHCKITEDQVDQNFTIGFDYSNFPKDFPEQNWLAIRDSCKRDGGTSNLVMSLTLYKYFRSRNYIFSKDMTQILMEIENNLKPINLPDTFSGYFEFNGLKDRDGDEVLAVFVTVHKFELGCYLVHYSYITDQDGVGYSSGRYENNDDRSVLEILKDKKHALLVTEEDPVDGLKLKKEVSDNADTEFMSFVLNAVLFITHDGSGLQEIKNEFTGSKKAKERQEKIYTSMSFYSVTGGGLIATRNQYISETNVRPFWRWQPYGPSHSLRRLTLVRGHTRIYREKD